MSDFKIGDRVFVLNQASRHPWTASRSTFKIRELMASGSFVWFLMLGNGGELYFPSDLFRNRKDAEAEAVKRNREES